MEFHYSKALFPTHSYLGKAQFWGKIPKEAERGVESRIDLGTLGKAEGPGDLTKDSWVKTDRKTN